MLNENDLQEFLLIAEDDISEATKTKADFKKGEFEIVGTAPNQMKRDAEGNLTPLTKKDIASKELDIDSKPKMKPKKMSMLDRVKAIKQGKLIDSSGKQRNDPKTEKDVRATNINKKNSAGKIDTQAILPSANPTGKVSGKAPTALGRQADRQAKDMMGPGAGSPDSISASAPKKAAPKKAAPKKAELSDDDLAKQGIRGGPIERRRQLAKDLAKMRAERKPRPETKGELARDYAARQSPKAPAAASKPKFVAQKGGQTPSQKAASRSGADISTNSAGSSRPASRTGADLSAPKIRPAPKPAATTKGADELDAAPARKIAAPKPPKKPKQSALDKAVADNARFQTDESKDFKVQSMREALEDVWRNGATVQENLRSSKESKGMRVLRAGKTMTGGRPAVIETNPKDPTSRNMGMTNEEFAIRDLTESMTDEEYQLFEISANAALSMVPDAAIKRYAGGLDAAAIRAMAKEYGIDLSELEGSISDMMKGNFDNVTYKGKPIPPKVKKDVIGAFVKGGGVKKIGKGSVRAAAKEAGKFAKGEDEPKLSSAVKKRRDEVLGKKGSNASEPKKVDTKKPDSEKDSEKVTRGRDKDGTPYVQKDITKDMEKLNKMKPKSDGASGEKDDEFLDDPKFKGKSKSKPVTIEITKGQKSGVDKSDDDKASRKGAAVPKKPKEGGEELDAAPAPSAPKDKKKEPEKKKDDPTEGGKYAYYEKDPKKRTKNSAMYMTQKGYDDENEKADGESFNAVDATSNFLSNISKDDTMYSWSLNTKK